MEVRLKAHVQNARGQWFARNTWIRVLRVDGDAYLLTKQAEGELPDSKMQVMVSSGAIKDIRS